VIGLDMSTKLNSASSETTFDEQAASETVAGQASDKKVASATRVWQDAGCNPIMILG